MTPVRAARRLVLLVVLASMSGGCGGVAATTASSTTSSTTTVDLTVFAAASLKDVLATAAAAYEAANPGTTVTISTDASSALATQITQGAPADLFLSADTRNPDALHAAGLTAGPTRPFAGNRLTVIVPTADPAGIRSPADLAKPGVRIIAAGDRVPITEYAALAVGMMSAIAGYPPDFATGYAANVVSKEDNVQAVVAKIELGEGDAAIVYATDARASDELSAIAIPAEAEVVATYGAVVIKASRQPAAAEAFVDWLAGPDGQAILASFGFLPPPS